MTALTMRFSKAAAEVANSYLIVVPNITFPKNIYKMLISFKSSHIVKKGTFSIFSYIMIFFGCIAKWSCSGLQSRLRRFDSGFSLH